MEIVKVNQDLCIGCGACAGIASDDFTIDDEGLAIEVSANNCLDNMSDSLKEDVIDALEGCPTGAIYKTEKED